MDLLRKKLIEEVGLTNSHYDELSQFITKVELRKKDILIKSGQRCDFIGFVESGVLRSFITQAGEEFNLDFYFPNCFVSVYSSFLTRVPSHGSIQALDDTTLYVISRTDYYTLLNDSKDWYKLGKFIADSLFIKKCRREVSFLMDNATKRYELLISTYPKIEQLVAQYHIASYLGIKPESLSRIKSLTYINE